MDKGFALPGEEPQDSRRAWRRKQDSVLFGSFGDVGDRDVLVLVGGQKVPPGFYELADFNVCVGSQPSSEVSSLALLLDRLNPGWEGLGFVGARKRVVPQVRGKLVVED